MENKIKKYFQHKEQKPQIHDVIFEMEYFLNLKLRITCGFSTILGFKPIIWIQYKQKQFIGLDREEWKHLMHYKDYINNALDQREFLHHFNLIDNDGERDVEYTFQYKNGVCYLVMKQGEFKIKFDRESWNSLIRIRTFLSSILCWNSILRKQLLHFYYEYYIPTCSALNKTYIQFCDIKGIHERDIEIDLTRICYEIGKKMQYKIKTDVKIHRLYLRMDNK